MPFNGVKLGFALLPQKAVMEDVESFVKGLKEVYPEAKVLVSTLQVSSDSTDPQVKNNPFVTFATACNVFQDLVARAYILLAVARTMELDYLVFNTGLLRYDVEATKQFVAHCEDLPVLDIIFGEPPIINPFKNTYRPEDLEALESPKVRQRLVVDTLINSILSPRNEYQNINAGLFCLKTNKDILQTLHSVSHYEDSSLVCSQMAWHMRLHGFRIGSVPVKDIKLKTIGFSLEKAIQELNYILNMVSRQMGGNAVVLSEKVSDLFHKKTPFNRWMSSNDEEWFYDVVVPRLKSLGWRI